VNTTTTIESETLWDARDVARYLKVSRSWVYRQAEGGMLPHLKVGGLVRFVPAEIIAYALSTRPAGGQMPRAAGE
jgi:excisionase family DNA binding protein